MPLTHGYNDSNQCNLALCRSGICWRDHIDYCDDINYSSNDSIGSDSEHAEGISGATSLIDPS